MKYYKILKNLARHEKVSEKEIETEMQLALIHAGLDCTVKEFIEQTTKTIRQRLYIV